ncbi:unnamed protein product [Closterium sp. NIES-54]
MASRTLVSGLPRSLPPLPSGPAPTYVPCVEGRQCAAPHSSEFPPTEAPLQTLHMDVWGLARVLIVWIGGVCRQLSESFGSDLPILRLHSDRGSEFSSDLLRAFCRAEGIRQTFTLLASPQQNGISECCIGLVMDVACTSMIHAAAPHFLWPFAVQYAAHQINLQPCVSLPETTPALCFGPSPSGVSPVDPVEPVKVAVDSGAARGGEPAGAGPGGAERGVDESERVEPGGAELGGAESGGAEPKRAESGGPPGVSSRREPLSPQWLREWFAQCCSRAAGATGPAAGGASGAGAAGGAAAAGAAGAAGPGGAGAGGTGVVGGYGAAGPGGSRTGGTGAAGAGGSTGVRAIGAGGVATGGAARAGAAGGTGAGAEVVAGDPGAEGTDAPAFPLPGPSPYSGPTRGLTGRREPESCPVSPKSRPASPESRHDTHYITLSPSTAPQRVPLSSPPASSLPDGLNPEFDSLRAASPTITHFLATAVTDPSFESTAVSALVAELVDFAAASCLYYAASLVAETESASVCPLSLGGECALGTDVLQDRHEEFECFASALPHLVSMLLAREGDPDARDIPTPRSYTEAIEGPYSSQWRTAMDTEMASWKSTGTYVDEVPPHGANIVSGMWIFRVKRLPGSPPVFKVRYVARGFRLHQHELHSLDFSTAFLQGSLHEEIWLHRPPGFTGSFPVGTQWSLRWPVYGLRQAPREWHDTLRTTVAALGFAPSTADPSLFLRATRSRVLQRFGFTYSLPQSTPLPTGHSLSPPPLDESIEPSGPYPELVACLMYLMTCTQPDLAYPLSILARYVAPGRHWKEPMDAAKRVFRYLCSMSSMGIVLGGRARVVLTGVTLAHLPDDRPGRVSPFSSAMLALCQEHRLEHRTKHIALRYFIARELQQRGQLRLAYVATRANSADVFTKALQPCDHQRFCTVLGLVPTVPHLLTS